MSRNICVTRCTGCSNKLTMDNLQLTMKEELKGIRNKAEGEIHFSLICLFFKNKVAAFR